MWDSLRLAPITIQPENLMGELNLQLEVETAKLKPANIIFARNV